jgi:hypothetical protein
MAAMNQTASGESTYETPIATPAAIAIAHTDGVRPKRSSGFTRSLR